MRRRNHCEADITDRRYLDWHYTLGGNVKSMDLDSIEFKSPAEPLAIVETTYTTDKFASITCEMARKQNIPGYIVVTPPPPNVGKCSECYRSLPYGGFIGTESVKVRSPSVRRDKQP